jgi:FKBP-type peptidyl-prolyl cis-trans isomerase FklB
MMFFHGSTHRGQKELQMRSPRDPVLRLAPAALLAAMLAGSGALATEATTPTASAATGAPKVAPVAIDVASYDVGLMLGSQLEHNGLAPQLSVDTLLRGLKDGLAGHAITAEERETALKYMRDARGALVEKNQSAAREFLEHNGTQPGIVTMPSGLQYRVLAEGDPQGKPPAPTDTVTVRYRASLADGTEFDRSETHALPATFRVNKVFKSWQEAFQAMKPGAKWQLFVPPELGYGANSPPAVPPGALVIYELELLRVEPAAPLDPAAAKPRPIPGPKPATPAKPH